MSQRFALMSLRTTGLRILAEARKGDRADRSHEASPAQRTSPLSLPPREAASKDDMVPAGRGGARPCLQTHLKVTSPFEPGEILRLSALNEVMGRKGTSIEELDHFPMRGQCNRLSRAQLASREANGLSRPSQVWEARIAQMRRRPRSKALARDTWPTV